MTATTTNTVQSAQCRAILGWLRSGKDEPRGLSALPTHKVEQARDLNRRLRDRRVRR
jgi:hypothetical protein